MPSLLSIVTTLLDPLIDIGAYVLTLLAALVPPTRRRQGASRALGIEIKLAGGSQAFSKWLPDVPLGTLADRTFLPQLAARIRRGLYSFSRAIAVWFIKEAQANLAISDAEYAKLVTPRKPARRPSLDWLGDFVPQVEFERDGPFRRAWDLQGNERQARRSRWTSERAPPLKLRRRWSWPSGQHAGEDWLGEQTILDSSSRFVKTTFCAVPWSSQPKRPSSLLASLATGVPQQIFESLRELGSLHGMNRDLLQFGLVCSDWATIYRKHFWEDVGLDDSTGGRATRSLLADNCALKQLVKKLRISWRVLGYRLSTSEELLGGTRHRRKVAVARNALAIIDSMFELQHLELTVTHGGRRRSLRAFYQHLATAPLEFFVFTLELRRDSYLDRPATGGAFLSRFVAPPLKHSLLDTIGALLQVLPCERWQGLTRLQLDLTIDSLPIPRWEGAASPSYHLERLSLTGLPIPLSDLLWISGDSSTSLTGLTLVDCTNITPFDLSTFFESHTNLAGLALNNLSSPQPHTFDTSLSSLSHLSHLEFTGTAFSEALLSSLHPLLSSSFQCLHLGSDILFHSSTLFPFVRTCGVLRSLDVENFYLDWDTVQEQEAYREGMEWGEWHGLVFNGKLARTVEGFGEEEELGIARLFA